jgi:peptidoglycan/xylan/chitin deacetylase (PgdA/CDA1 family)
MAVTRRDFLKMSLGVAAWAALRPVAEAASAAPATSLFQKCNRGLPYVALSLDDMWDYGMLAVFEALLAEQPQIRVTFFPVGKAILAATAADAGIWLRLVQQGHEIGYHTFDHRRPDEVSDEEYALYFQYWQYALRQALGYLPPVRFGRPPFGILSPSFYRLCAAQQMIIAMWCRSWPRRLLEDHPAITGLAPGDIVLLHGNNYDYDNLQQGITLVGERSWTAVTLSQLYTIHHNPLAATEPPICPEPNAAEISCPQ